MFYLLDAIAIMVIMDTASRPSIAFQHIVRKIINKNLRQPKISLSHEKSQFHYFDLIYIISEKPQNKTHTKPVSSLWPKSTRKKKTFVILNHCLLLLLHTHYVCGKIQPVMCANVNALLKERIFVEVIIQRCTFIFYFLGQNANFSRYQKLLAFSVLSFLLYFHLSLVRPLNL